MIAQSFTSWMSRAKPPLRKEVVEYVLDLGLQTWSLRRGKANLARIDTRFE